MAWNAFIHRLEHGANLSEIDRIKLSHLIKLSRHVKADQLLVQEGDTHTNVIVVLDGWAQRWKMLSTGLRQITDLMLPGDMDYPHSPVASYIPHSVSTLTNCVIAEISSSDLLAAMEGSPSVRRAMRWSTLQSDCILREALTNNGRRQAPQRIAHLICEIILRLRSAGVIDQWDISRGFAWPITQIELSDLTGMTSVHLSRTMMAMRKDGLFSLYRRCLRVPDMRKLEIFGDFQPDYLQISRIVDYHSLLSCNV